MKKVRKKGQKRCNRYGYIASFKNCPLEHSANALSFFTCTHCAYGWRRRRDSNPRAGFPTYTLSRGASSAYLSTSPNRITKNMKKMWRRGRDSNSWYLRITGFQDQLLKPLGHLSRYTQLESLFRNRRN